MASRCQVIFRKPIFGFWILWALNVSAFADAMDFKKPSREIQENGQAFVLIASSSVDGVETEEYGLKGETEKKWSELIVYQRLALAAPSGADEYILSLKRRVEDSRRPGRFRIIQENNRAAVFAVEYDGEKPASTELTLGLAVATEGAQSQEIQLIQYTVLPARIPIEKLAQNVQRWKARFQSKARFAAALNALGK